MRWRLLNRVDVEELPTDVGTMLEDERRAIRERRSQASREALDINDLSALCLSGGGIRSAAFGLGVLQSLAARGILSQFDYLSTVSGGGYIGGWLTAWIRREGADKAFAGLAEPAPSQNSPITYLRRYSRYLTPHSGLLSADSLTVVSLFARNLLLNWTIIVPLFIALVLAVKIFFGVVLVLPTPAAAFMLVGGISFVGYALFQSVRRRPGFEKLASAPYRYFLDELLPLLVGIIFICAGAASGLNWEKSTSGSLDFSIFAGVGVGIYLVAWALAYIFSFVIELPPVDGKEDAAPSTEENFESQVKNKLWWPVARAGFCYVGSGAITGLLIAFMISLLRISDAPHWREVFVISFGPVIFVIALFIAELFYIGFNSATPWGDAEREWLARAGGSAMAFALGLCGLFALVLIGSPLVLEKILPAVTGEHSKTLLTSLAAFSSIVSGIISAIMGRMTRTGSSRSTLSTSWSDRSINVLLAVMTVFFLTTTVILTSAFLDELLLGHALGYEKMTGYDWLYRPEIGLNPSDVSVFDWLLRPAEFFIVLVLVILIASRCININKFSLHNLYRNRLIRSFLGASNLNRKPNPFTDFSDGDNLKLHELWPASSDSSAQGLPPIHVINMALNVVATKQLAWQERKAISFTATPKWIGSGDLEWEDENGVTRRGTYRPSEFYGAAMSLGTAMTLSGAAASPNMGYHSSPWLSLILTFFNVRLGGWYGNPNRRGARTFKEQSPRRAAKALLTEAFGRTTDQRSYVYLSDGGHFENLGAYEMVRRRCRFIVIIDAGSDPKCTFEDLGNFVRRAALDFGVKIHFRKLDIKARAVPPVSGIHCAVADIVYPDSSALPGLLLYIKPGYNGVGPASVISYANQHDDFPHESTSNQWFGEIQFEAYRALGEYVMESIASVGAAPKTIEELVTRAQV
ncbi:MAG TPA: patatin-like phospholipase family protein [Pseudolabrys sp.]